MGESLTKGEAYEEERREKNELFVLKMKYMVWGPEILTKKEFEKLQKSGAIKPTKKRLELQFKVEREDDAVQGPGGGHDHP